MVWGILHIVGVSLEKKIYWYYRVWLFFNLWYLLTFLHIFPVRMTFRYTLRNYVSHCPITKHFFFQKQTLYSNIKLYNKLLCVIKYLEYTKKMYAWCKNNYLKKRIPHCLFYAFLLYMFWLYLVCIWYVCIYNVCQCILCWRIINDDWLIELSYMFNGFYQHYFFSCVNNNDLFAYIWFTYSHICLVSYCNFTTMESVTH